MTQVPPAAGSGASAPDQLRRQTAAEIDASLKFAQIVGILASSPTHSRMPLGDINWLVIPPLMAGQFTIATGRPQADLPMHAAVALWALVSPEVDHRLATDLATPVRLTPAEWRSGPIPWLIEATGEPQLLAPLLARLNETTFKGQDVKVRLAGADGKSFVGRLSQLAQPQASA